jgi:hypothetical protein
VSGQSNIASSQVSDILIVRMPKRALIIDFISQKNKRGIIILVLGRGCA